MKHVKHQIFLHFFTGDLLYKYPTVLSRKTKNTAVYFNNVGINLKIGNNQFLTSRNITFLVPNLVVCTGCSSFITGQLLFAIRPNCTNRQTRSIGQHQQQPTKFVSPFKQFSLDIKSLILIYRSKCCYYQWSARVTNQPERSCPHFLPTVQI